MTSIAGVDSRSPIISIADLAGIHSLDGFRRGGEVVVAWIDGVAYMVREAPRMAGSAVSILVTRPGRAGDPVPPPGGATSCHFTIDPTNGDVLLAIDERTGRIVLEIGGEPFDQEDYALLSMSSNFVSPGAAVTVSRRLGGVFLPGRIVIGGDPGSWSVSGIRISGVPRLPDAVPGRLFSSASMDALLALDPVLPGEDLEIDATNNASIDQQLICAVLGKNRVRYWRHFARLIPGGRDPDWPPLADDAAAEPRELDGSR